MKANVALLKKAAVTTTLTGTVLAVPTMANAHFGTELLSKGMKNKHVKELQEILHKEGYYEISKASGYFGAATEKAVRDFQKDHDLVVDGLVGPNTKKELNKKTKFFGELLSQGDRGEHVESIQNHLKELGYYTGNIDGIFGPKTRLAVMRFQKENDIQIDGIFGPQTYKALHNEPEEYQPKAVASTSTTSTQTAEVSNNTSQSVASSTVREFYVESTAYTAYCTGCSGTTATGINLRANPDAKVVAVDPDVIPLGTKLYVEGYGYAIAGDTGGAIQGRRIDVFFPSRQDALEWGRRTVKVRILK